MAPKLPPFAVSFNEMPTHRVFTITPVLVGDWLRGLPIRDALGAPEDDPEAGTGTGDLELYSEGEHGFATGTFKGHLQVACSRCVEPMRIELDERVQVTFMPKHEMPEDDAEAEDGVEVSDEDLDLFPYEGDFIDLEPVFREQFVLAIPYAPLCREDCKGLCSQCGIDLNSGTCACEMPIDPRLAALKGLKIPS